MKHSFFCFFILVPLLFAITSCGGDDPWTVDLDYANPSRVIFVVDHHTQEPVEGAIVCVGDTCSDCNHAAETVDDSGTFMAEKVRVGEEDSVPVKVRATASGYTASDCESTTLERLKSTPLFQIEMIHL